MPWDKKAPYNKETGQLCSYQFPYELKQGRVEMRPVVNFEATLTYKGYFKGRSSVLIHLEDENGLMWPMFLSAFDKLISKMTHGVITGTWTVVKRGNNYGITLACLEL